MVKNGNSPLWKERRRISRLKKIEDKIKKDHRPKKKSSKVRDKIDKRRLDDYYEND